MSFPIEHGPECEGSGPVHILSLCSQGSTAGFCLGCRIVVMRVKRTHPPMALCSACETGERPPTGGRPEGVYDTEIWWPIKSESRVGERLFGWGRK